MKKTVWFKVLMTAATAIFFVLAARAQDEPQTRVLVPRTEQNDNGEFVARLVEEVVEQADDAPQGDYWLGLQIAALPEVVKKQLAVEHGLTVEEVSPDSPAAKAEIKKYDILVKADDQPLNAYGDLIKVVEDSQGKEIVITIVRGGKDATVKVAPIKRPPSARVEIRAPRPELRAEIKGLEEALENLKNKMGKDGASLWFPKPAIVAPRVELKFDHKLTKTEFPKDLTVQINKQGTKPAEIHVKRGDKSWEVTEEKLDDLPEDIRGHVQQMLGRRGVMALHAAPARAIQVTPEGKVHGEIRIAPVPPVPPAPAAAPRPPVAPAAPYPQPSPRPFSFRSERSDDGGDSKLDAILKKLEKIESGTLDKLDKDMKQMRMEIDELRKKSPSDSR